MLAKTTAEKPQYEEVKLRSGAARKGAGFCLRDILVIKSSEPYPPYGYNAPVNF